jgi:hypothetical protein
METIDLNNVYMALDKMDDVQLEEFEIRVMRYIEACYHKNRSAREIISYHPGGYTKEFDVRPLH